MLLLGRALPRRLLRLPPPLSKLAIMQTPSPLRRGMITYHKAIPAKDPNRPFRSVLFAPGSRLGALKKCATVPADVVAFDLEDAVAPDRKVEARETVKQVLNEVDFGRRYVAVRANGFGTKWWTEDIAAIAESNANAILIPKVENPDVLITVNELLHRYGADPNMAIWAMIETPYGVVNIREIAAAHDHVMRLEALMIGTSDLTNELRALHSPDRTPLLYSLSKCVVAARAYKLRVIDGVCLNLGDDQAFEQLCLQGRELGFDGKQLIHPKTVEMANRIFGPSKEDVEHARKVLEAWNDANSKGQGVCLLDGKLIENLHVDEANRTLDMQSKIEANEQAAAAASAQSSS